MAGLMQHANTQEAAQYAQQLNWEKTEVVRERADKSHVLGHGRVSCTFEEDAQRSVRMVRSGHTGQRR